MPFQVGDVVMHEQLFWNGEVSKVEIQGKNEMVQLKPPYNVYWIHSNELQMVKIDPQNTVIEEEDPVVIWTRSRHLFPLTMGYVYDKLTNRVVLITDIERLKQCVKQEIVVDSFLCNGLRDFAELEALDPSYSHVPLDHWFVYTHIGTKIKVSPNDVVFDCLTGNNTLLTRIIGNYGGGSFYFELEGKLIRQPWEIRGIVKVEE